MAVPLVRRQAVLAVCPQRREPAALPNRLRLGMLVGKHGMNVNPSKQSSVGLCRVHVCHLGIWEGASGVSGAMRAGTSEQMVLKQHNYDNCTQTITKCRVLVNPADFLGIILTLGEEGRVFFRYSFCSTAV